MAVHSDSLPAQGTPPIAPITIGIDASNLSSGGGVTHLVELLAAADPARHRFARIVVWSSRATLAQLAPRPWLEMQHEPVLEAGFVARSRWQHRRLGELARATGADVLFVPGGSFGTDFRPIVTMSRNLLPFEWRELARYGVSGDAVKMLLLRFAQSRSLRGASGSIFLTHYAMRTVMRATGPLRGGATIIPHGVDARFFLAPRPQQPPGAYGAQRPFRLLYVSSVDHYKHPWHLVDAVARLRDEGLPLALDLVGAARPSALRRLEAALRRHDPSGEWARFLGPLPHAGLHRAYADADAFAYASSCENLPNILLEAMAAGLPIACSERGPMPEVLGEAGLYFDPEQPESIANALRALFADPERRATLAAAARRAALPYSWDRCADATIAYLHEVAMRDRPGSLA